MPGIDLAGTVEGSSVPAFRAGDPVLATGYYIGERQWGGWGARARVRAEHLVPMPAGLDAKRAMAIGTAGFTAMQALLALEDHGLTPAKGEVLVTGAAGGVGSIAVAILAKLGYRVAAATGRADQHDYLKGLGAGRIVERAALATPSGKPLEKEVWAGAIDSVGGETLATALRQTLYGGSVAACGLAGGAGLPATVLPFILRGVNLLGIDSVQCPMARRRTIWDRLAADLPEPMLDAATQVVGLGEVIGIAPTIIGGGVRGRIVVDLGR